MSGAHSVFQTCMAFSVSEGSILMWMSQMIHMAASFMLPGQRFTTDLVWFEDVVAWPGRRSIATYLASDIVPGVDVRAACSKFSCSHRACAAASSLPARDETARAMPAFS
jgi:hypothetical protein